MKTGKNIAALLAAGAVMITGLAAADSAAAAGISSANQAREKALKKVPNAVVTDTDLDTENGEQVYEIELVKGSKKYDITYRASDGKMTEYGWEKTTVSPSRNRAVISEEKCRRLALDRVKNATITAVSQKTDDGIDIYKVKMKKGSKKYELEFHARTGKLLEYEWELTTKSSNKNNYIGTAKAKEIALKKVGGGHVIKVEFDMDDGVPVYEVEIIKGDYEYDVEIHAKTGKILEVDKDYIYD